MTPNPCLYTGYYKRSKVVLIRQREDLKTHVDDMNEEMESADRELLDDSASTRARQAMGKLVKGVSVPTFAAQTVHGPVGSTLQAIETATGCVDLIMEIKIGSKTQNLTIYAIEGEADLIDWVENIITIIVIEQTRGMTEGVQAIAKEVLRISVMEGDTAAGIFSHISTGEMATATLVNTGMDDRVQAAYSIRQCCKLVSTRRLQEYITVIQTRTTRDRAHKQADKIEQDNYAEITVTDDRFKVGTEVWIINDDITTLNYFVLSLVR